MGTSELTIRGIRQDSAKVREYQFIGEKIITSSIESGIMGNLSLKDFKQIRMANRVQALITN
jgi:hypothetical protein